MGYFSRIFFYEMYTNLKIFAGTGGCDHLTQAQVGLLG